MDRSLSAPSKLFVSGEYAVLWGGTARVAAVGPRASAYVRRRDDREVHIVLKEGRLSGRATPSGVNWQREISPSFHFVASTLSEVVRARGRGNLGFELALAPSPVAPSGHKLGMGGSARATLLAVEAARFALEERFDPLRLAIFAHSQVQGKRGSGADVAAIYLGGMVRYRRYCLDPLVAAATSGNLWQALANAPPVDLLRAPVGNFALGYAFAKASASTPNLIAHVEQKTTKAARDAFVRTSDQLGLNLEEALTGSDFAEVSRISDELHQLLTSLGSLETEPIRCIRATARAKGCAAKISGAGGGDGCILFAPDLDGLNSLLLTLEAQGWWSTSLALEEGLKVEASPDPTLKTWLDE